MKKVYISADIEGIWGNGAAAHTARSGAEYEEYRLNMIREVNLLVDKLFAHGVEEVLVNDGHGNMDNLTASMLDARAGIVVSNGAYKAYGMMEGLDDTFDGVALVGYHCRSNTHGVMAHTIWESLIRSIEVDGVEMGESGINARLAREYGVPIILVSGDDVLYTQLQTELLAPFAYVETKKAISNQCAICCSWQMLDERYEQAVCQALEQEYDMTYPKQAHIMQEHSMQEHTLQAHTMREHSMQTNMTQAPMMEEHMVQTHTMEEHTTQTQTTQTHTITITFHHERHADFVARMDGITRVSACSVSLTKPSYAQAYAYMRFAIKISNAFAS